MATAPVVNWSNGGSWKDATNGVFPDWVQINFSGPKTIDRVIVYTMQDSYASPVDPPDTLTFTQYGVTDFQVQGWNGSAWVTLGSVAGNNRVKRQVNFAATTTDRIRVNITGGMAGYSRLIEVEAYTGGAAPAPTTTTLTTSPNPSTFGSSVTFTATITGNAPAGTVGFTDGGITITGCGTAAVNAAKATCTTTALTVGSHSLVATYSGDTNNAGSVSPALTQTVNKAASGTTLTTSPNPSTFGSSVTFTATITGNAPAGTVGFTDGGINHPRLRHGRGERGQGDLHHDGAHGRQPQPRRHLQRRHQQRRVSEPHADADRQ